MNSFHLVNFGCRATQADGAAIERELLDSGLFHVDESQAAVVVLNTCTVTAAADADARAAIRRIHRNNPQAKLLVTGCYAQRAPQELAALPGVAWVVGNSHKTQVARVAAEMLTAKDAKEDNSKEEQDRDNPAESPLRFNGTDDLQEPGDLSALISLDQIAPAEEAQPSESARLLIGDIFAHTEVLAAPVFEGDASASGFAARTRANLKVQDGCNNRCSFCIIPFVRGRSRSLPLEKVLSEAMQLERAGFQEIVLSGINLGRWGRDFDLPNRSHFPALLRHLLANTSVSRFRISSVEPMDWCDELIALVASEARIAKHAHVPLQSGSDRVLRLMHRKYRPWHYEEKIAKLRQAMPSAAIGADVMTGFPGESDTLFRETYEFIERLPFTYLHVFTFSARPGTPAATMSGQVPVHIARERNRLLRELIAEKNVGFRKDLIGTCLPAITLSRSAESNTTDALTDNFVKLSLEGEHAPNQWHAVNITGLTEAGLSGRIA